VLLIKNPVFYCPLADKGLKGQPIVNIKTVETVCGLSTKAANDLVSKFEECKWLQKTGNIERYRTFIFEPYISLFE